MEKQQIIGKSCALTTAASVTATGEQRDLGTEDFWAWEWSGDRANTGDGEEAQREPCSAGHGAARKLFYWEKSGMVLRLFRGSLELEIGDELGSSAAVTFMEVKSVWPQLSTDIGGAGHRPPPDPIRVSVLRSPQRRLLYASKAPNTFPCVLMPPDLSPQRPTPS